ncbi:hypothetical protein BGZ93_010872 [Podila epicladia]|nr:hypothetical protein BGZ93_010872 [Podila epicladia]
MDWSVIEEETSGCFSWFMVWIMLGGVVGMTHGSESKKSSDISGLLAAESGGSAVGDDNDEDDEDDEELAVLGKGLIGADSKKARGSDVENVVATLWHKTRWMVLATVVVFVGGTATYEFLEDVLGNAGIKREDAVKMEPVAISALHGDATESLFVVGPVVMSFGG